MSVGKVIGSALNWDLPSSWPHFGGDPATPLRNLWHWDLPNNWPHFGGNFPWGASWLENPSWPFGSSKPKGPSPVWGGLTKQFFTPPPAPPPVTPPPQDPSGGDRPPYNQPPPPPAPAPAPAPPLIPP